MSYLFSVDIVLNLFVIVSQIDVVNPLLSAIGRNGIITFPVVCAERDYVRSKVFTEKLDSYTRIFSRKQNKPLLSFQLQSLHVVESLT